jgi:hypothetical protein
MQAVYLKLFGYPSGHMHSQLTCSDLLFIGYSKNKKITEEIVDMSYCMAVVFRMAYGAYTAP